MLGRAFAGVAFAFSLGAQDYFPKPPEKEDDSSPLWNAVAPEPPPKVCSIPLVEVRPKKETPYMPRFAPRRGEWHMRMLKPPAPPCEQARGSILSEVKPRPEKRDDKR
jgi:hypothetical protein